MVEGELMSYNALVSSNVRKVFNLVKDLASPVMLTKKENVNFNFGSGKVTSDAPVVLNTKIVITEENKTSKDNYSEEKIGLLKTQDIGDISSYTTATIAGEVWKLGPVIKTDRFVTIVTLYK
jgi:hypothetical protein